MLKGYRLPLIIIFILLLLLFIIFWLFLNKEELVMFDIPPIGADRQNCSTCHSGDSMGFGKEFLHPPAANWQCTICHYPHDTGEESEHLLKAQPQELCSLCHKFEQEQPQLSVHPPFANGDCQDCHVPHSSDYLALSRSDPAELCVTCHFVADLWAMEQVHPPFGEGDCLACHRPHQSAVRKLQRQETKQLCFTCHFDHNGELRMPTQHKPFQQGRCTGCHPAHAAAVRPLLLLPKQRLCLFCHNDFRNLPGYVHKPVDEGNCSQCHRPHATVEPSLLSMPVMELCFSCHRETKQQFGMSSHHPVFEKNNQLECTSCHGVHNGAAPGMLPYSGNRFCYQCHDHVRDSFEKMPHNFIEGPAGTGSCRSCHLYHGSQYPPLLAMEPLPLCSGCHTEETLRMHPVGPNYPDPWGDGYTQCISCHEPHGTGAPNSLVEAGDKLCLRCHRWNPINPNGWRR